MRFTVIDEVNVITVCKGVYRQVAAYRRQKGKDNACWYLFDKNFTGQTEFYGR